MRIAVVGSRDTKPEINNLIYATLRYITQQRNVELVSGGCDEGPDRALTELVLRYPDTLHTIYLPTASRQRKFAYRYPHHNTVVAVEDYKGTEPYRRIVAELHPAPDRLDDYTWSLHGRNLNIIAGPVLTEPVDAVIYAGLRLSNGRVKGGTGMGIAYAESLEIPCYNYTQPKEIAKFYNTLTNNK